MFILLESSEDIAKAERVLVGTMQHQFKRRVFKDIGYPGGTTTDAEVFTDGKYWFHSRDHDSKEYPNPRRLNWFGIYREHAGLEISVEINSAYQGRNDGIAGFFARDADSGIVYLCHSGRVGGGRKGVGKIAFLAWSNLPRIDVFDSKGNVRHGVSVMPIKGTAASKSLVWYITP
jgi:hypothetical protein